MINVSDDNDMGRGPSMHKGEVNPRLATKARVTQMHITAGNGTRIQSSTPNNAIVISVFRDCLDLDSLTRDGSTAEFEDVRWNDGASDSSCLLINGASRVGMMQQLVLNRQIEGVKELNGAISLECRNPRQDQKKLGKHRRRLSDGLRYLCKEGKWLALFIDAGECQDVDGAEPL